MAMTVVETAVGLAMVNAVSGEKKIRAAMQQIAQGDDSDCKSAN